MFQKDINAVNAQLNKEAFIGFTGQDHELEPEEEYAANAYRDFKALLKQFASAVIAMCAYSPQYHLSRLHMLNSQACGYHYKRCSL